MPNELRFDVGDTVVCVDNSGVDYELTAGKTYLVSSCSRSAVFVGVDGAPSPNFFAKRFRRASLDEIAEYAKTNPRPFFKVGDVVTCVSTDGSSAVLAVGQTYRVTDAYGGEFVTSIFYTMPSTLHQYLGVVSANERGRCLGQSFLRFRKATPSEIEAFDKQAVAAKPTEAPKTAEAPKASEPIEKFYVGQQVVLSAKGRRNKELRKFLGGQEHAIIDEVRRDSPIWITRPDLPGDEDAPRTAGRQTVLADEIVPVERDYYLVPGGTIIEKGDEWWDRDAWRSANYSVGSRLLISTPLRRRKPTSLSGHSVEPNEFVKILGPSREIESAPFWNPIMSNMIGKVFCVERLVAFGTGLAVRIHDERSYEWTLAYDWVSRPTESEIKAYQDSLAKVEAAKKASDAVDRVAEGCAVVAQPVPTITWDTPESLPFSKMELEFRWLPELGGHMGACSAAWRGLQRAMKDKITIVSEGIKIEGVVELITSSSLAAGGSYEFGLRVIPTSVIVENKAPPVAQAEPEAPKPSSQCPAEPGEGYRFLDPKELVVEGDEWWRFGLGWTKSLNYLGAGKQAPGETYRRRNKFAVGELVRIIKPLDIIQRPTWLLGMDQYDGEVAIISGVDRDGDCRLVGKQYYFNPDWLAPASSSQREKAEKPSSQCPAEPGEGYRFLDPKELLVEGDEFWGCTFSGDYGWEPTGNHHHGGKQGWFKYRRRNKFAEGELVRIVKPLDTTVGPGWMSCFDRWINENKVLTITELASSRNYRVAENHFAFAPNWLAPASKEQKAQKEKEAEAKKAQIAELEGKMKDIQSQLDFLRK